MSLELVLIEVQNRLVSVLAVTSPVILITAPSHTTHRSQS